jgi:hypothetical protein
MIQRHYDTLKNWAQIYLPALGTLYFTIATIWHIPYAEEVLGSIIAVDTFLGVILKISTGKYTPPTDGDLLVDPDRAGRYQLDIATPLDDIPGKNQIRLNVKQETF